MAESGGGGGAGPEQEHGYRARCARLETHLAGLGRLAVAFSGGVDSSVLLHAAHRVLGVGALGVIADSPSLARRDLAEARALARSMGARLVVVPTAELADADYNANRGDRCYHCKAALFQALRAVCSAEGIDAMAFGEIVDDLAVERPGARAAAERGVLSPLVRAGFTKADVRRYAREAGLAVADRPANACLASRIPVGTAVTAVRLGAVERAEDALRDLGLVHLRVRHRRGVGGGGPRARVEVGPGELAAAEGLRAAIGVALAAAGFGGFELAAYVPPSPRPRRP